MVSTWRSSYAGLVGVAAVGGAEDLERLQRRLVVDLHHPVDRLDRLPGRDHPLHLLELVAVLPRHPLHRAQRLLLGGVHPVQCAVGGDGGTQLTVVLLRPIGVLRGAAQHVVLEVVDQAAVAELRLHLHQQCLTGRHLLLVVAPVLLDRLHRVAGEEEDGDGDEGDGRHQQIEFIANGQFIHGVLLVYRER